MRATPASRPSYYALRVCIGSDTPRWWSLAGARAATAPEPMQALISGRRRVEVSAAEAAAALTWARAIDGWNDDERPPVYRHPPLDT